jgi:hypothetical protein
MHYIDLLVEVFKFLDRNEVDKCALVQKVWGSPTIHSQLKQVRIFDELYFSPQLSRNMVKIPHHGFEKVSTHIS